MSSRMGEDKLIMEYRGETFLRRLLDLSLKLPVYERILVTTKPRKEHPRIASILSDFCVIENDAPELGQSESIRLGIEAASGTHFFFFPADQPLLTLNDIEPYFDAAKAHNDKIIFPVIDNKPSSPTLFPARFRTELLELSGDKGGSRVRNANMDSCHTFSPITPGHFTDIDSVEDLGFTLGGMVIK